jgi:hypothetical protein
MLIVAAALIAACGPSGPESKATDLGTTSLPSPSVSPVAPPPAATATAAPTRTLAPLPTRSPSPTAAATSGPTAPPIPGASPTASAGPGASPGDLAACSGSDANRAFFASAAAAVPWDVYCAVLPKGWFVESGSRKGGAAGQLVIAYKTNAGLRLELKQGNFCSGTPAACGPMDSTVGPATYSDRQGQLGALSGNLVLYVNPGSSPAWQAVGVGLSESTFRAFCAALVKVPG